MIDKECQEHQHGKKPCLSFLSHARNYAQSYTLDFLTYCQGSLFCDVGLEIPHNSPEVLKTTGAC
jgi:hypothetical protein